VERSRSRRRRKKRRPGGSPQPAEGPSAPAAEDGVPPAASDEAVATSSEIRIWTAPTGKASGKARGREMVINVTGDDECRVAILNNGRLEELFIERQSAQSHVGNIYKGRITNVEPSIQAAFVDFGFPKNGFLHVSDVQPQYFPNRGGQSEAVGKKVPRRDRPPIQRCFRRGQEVIVQITKEGVGTKGPTLTTYLSIPGRFLVMMPGMDKVGLSRKIEDEEARRKMREVMNQLTFPDNIGFILRTAGLDQSKRELQRDLNYLMRLWKTVSERVRTLPPPAELYQDSDLVTRTLRDVYTSDFERIVVDHEETGRKSLEFLQIAAPRTANNVELYTDTKPIFHAFGVEEQIDLIHSRHVPLPSGGTLVIDSTEAMVAIDVNSGKFRDLDDAEETAYKINMEAAEEIARQLRLRDLGGLIVCDFIDMRFDRHKRAVEKVLRDALKKHKERARILRMSQFGLIEMTRQRQRPSIRRGIYADCPHCRGTGQIKTPESMSLEVMRILQLAAHSRQVFRITLTASPKTALMVLNERRNALHQLQEASGKTIIVQADPTFAPDQIQVQCEDNRGRPVNIPT
jgi:ribonuclease E